MSVSDDISPEEFSRMMGEPHTGYSSLKSQDIPRLNLEQDAYVKKLLNARGIMLEAMAAAFIKETGLIPSQAELVQQQLKDGSIRLFFRKRTG